MRTRKMRPTKKPRGKRLDEHGLEPRQSLFVAEYLKDLNATQAAIRAGYSTKGADAQASRLLGNVRIQAALADGLKRILEKPLSEAEKVIAEAVILAHSDVGNFLDDAGNIVNMKELPSVVRRAVSSIEVIERRLPGKDGEVERTKKIRFWDKNAALGLLAKYHKLSPERHEHEHKGAIGVVTSEQASALSDDELIAEAKRLAEEAAELAARLAGR